MMDWQQVDRTKQLATEDEGYDKSCIIQNITQV